MWWVTPPPSPPPPPPDPDFNRVHKSDRPETNWGKNECCNKEEVYVTVTLTFCKLEIDMVKNLNNYHFLLRLFSELDNIVHQKDYTPCLKMLCCCCCWRKNEIKLSSSFSISGCVIICSCIHPSILVVVVERIKKKKKIKKKNPFEAALIVYGCTHPNILVTVDSKIIERGVYRAIPIFKHSDD